MIFDWENFTYNPIWLQEAVQIETAADCDIQIGGETPHSSQSIASTELQAQLKQVRLQSLLFGELRTLLEGADLGAGTEAAITEGRQLFRAKLQHLTSEQHQYFEGLIIENKTSAEDKPLRAQLRQVLCSLLSQPDWQEIAQATIGTLQAHLLKQVALH